jgi:hypothetical protein
MHFIDSVAKVNSNQISSNLLVNWRQLAIKYYEHLNKKLKGTSSMHQMEPIISTIVLHC